MSDNTANPRKKILRRTVVVSVSLLALCAAGGLGFTVVEKVRDTADRAH